VHVSHRPHQIVGHRALEHIRGGAGLQRPVNVLVALVHREDDDSRGDILGAKHADGIEATHGRKLEVHQRDVRPMFAKLQDALLTGGDRGHDLHVGLTIDLPGDCLAYQRMVIDA
jgi:hypothetical protein